MSVASGANTTERPSVFTLPNLQKIQASWALANDGTKCHDGRDTLAQQDKCVSIGPDSGGTRPAIVFLSCKLAHSS